MVQLLAFDVSETLQTSSEHNDSGLGQQIINQKGQCITNAYSVLVGGQTTADLLIAAQKQGVTIVLVTNNSSDLDKRIIERTLAFLANYGVVIPVQNYLGPPQGTDGSKVPCLEETLLKYNIAKEDLVFFDDSRVDIEEAQDKGFRAIRVKSPTDLQDGIRASLFQIKKEEHGKPLDDFAKEVEDFKAINDQVYQILGRAKNGSAYKVNGTIRKAIRAIQDSTTTLSLEEQYEFYKMLYIGIKHGSDSLLRCNNAEDIIKAPFGNDELSLSIAQWRENYLEKIIDKIALHMKAIEENPVSKATLGLTTIDKILTTLRSKVEKEEQHIYPEAHQKALELLGRLENARNEYATGLEKAPHDAKVLKQHFINNCKLAIDDAKQVLDRDLGWEDYLINLFKSLANVVIGTFSQNQTFFTLKHPKSSEAVDEAWCDLGRENLNQL